MPPERFKTDEEMTPAEHLEHSRTGERPESDAHREAKRKALEAAGLEPDDEAPDPENPRQHLKEIQNR